MSQPLGAVDLVLFPLGVVVQIALLVSFVVERPRETLMVMLCTLGLVAAAVVVLLP